MRRMLVLMATLAAVAAGCVQDRGQTEGDQVVASAQTEHKHLEELEPLFGPGNAQLVVAKPTTVRAYRLADDSFYQADVADYEVISGPVDVGDELAMQAAALLLDPDSYLWDAAKGCEPVYGVRLEFVQGETTVDVAFCFDCDILSVYTQGKAVGGEDFDNIRPQLVGIMQKIFPKDEAIQSLKANG